MGGLGGAPRWEIGMPLLLVGSVIAGLTVGVRGAGVLLDRRGAGGDRSRGVLRRAAAVLRPVTGDGQASPARSRRSATRMASASSRRKVGSSSAAPKASRS